MKFNKKSAVPVLAAAVFLLVSLVLCVLYMVTAKVQAKRWVKELYTVSRQLDMDEWYEMEAGERYRRRFGTRITEEGREDLEKLGLPYVILIQQTPSPVERSYVTEVETELIETSEKKKKSFHYEVEIDVTLQKGDQVLAPVEEQSYHGTVILEKNKIFGWKLAGISIE